MGCERIASVLRGLHYEVRHDRVIRWWEPGTEHPDGMGRARQESGEWYREQLGAFSEIPLADVCSLSPYIANWQAFVAGDPILTATVASLLEAPDAA